MTATRGADARPRPSGLGRLDRAADARSARCSPPCSTSGSRPRRAPSTSAGSPSSCSLIQVATGTLLALYYKPTPDAAYDSILSDHERRPLRVAHPERPPLGGEPDDPVRRPAPAAGLLPGRLQVPAGADLDRRASVCSGSRWSSASPATCSRGTSEPTGRRSSGRRSRASVPIIGDQLLLLLRGGADVTEATLSRFFGIHVLVHAAGARSASWSST